jgi:hypothetical protein
MLPEDRRLLGELCRWVRVHACARCENAPEIAPDEVDYSACCEPMQKTAALILSLGGIVP